VLSQICHHIYDDLDLGLDEDDDSAFLAFMKAVAFCIVSISIIQFLGLTYCIFRLSNEALSGGALSALLQLQLSVPISVMRCMLRCMQQMKHGLSLQKTNSITISLFIGRLMATIARWVECPFCPYSCSYLH
jgi:hypothetical protein